MIYYLLAMKSRCIALVMMFAHMAFAQMESFPCETPNAALFSLFATGKLAGLYVHDCAGDGLHALSTSFLKPSGTPPAIPETAEGNPPDDAAYVEWTCRYTAGKLQDGNTKTAWVEGADGNGLAEVVIVPCLDLQLPVEIWAGFGKSESLFLGSNRPKAIRVAIIESQQTDPTQYGTYYRDLSIVAQHDVSLQDLNGFQSLPLPTFEVKTYFDERVGEERTASYFLGIQIISVYQGARWKDTCISEVRNVR